MSSRSPTPPPPLRVSDLDEPSMGRLSLRTRRFIRSSRRLSGPTAASMHTPSPRSIRSRSRSRSRRRLPGPTDTSMPTASIPVDPTAASVSTTATPVDLFQFSTGGPSYASVVRFGLDTVPKAQPQHESGSESDLELDSPPHYTVLEYQEFVTTPISPSASRLDDTPPPSPPPLSDIGPAVLPTFCSDAEDYHSSDDQEEDPYFKNLVDNFIGAAENVWNNKSILPEDTMSKEVGHQRQSNEFAVSALEHYNKDEENKVKYELISAITSCGIMDMKGCYGHVNFTAKGNQKNSKEELFFAELRFNYDTCITTCVFSLDGVRTIGGLRESKYDKGGMGFRIDAQHCYACGRRVKHPKNGTLYEIGHVASSDYYHG